MAANRIRSIEIDNFLSFKGKTTIEFHKGLNAIIGPNGGGKSNLLRAIFFGYQGKDSCFLKRWGDGERLAHCGSKAKPLVRCTPHTQTLTGAIALADYINFYDGLSMSPEGRAALALTALADGKLSWSELITGFERRVRQLSSKLPKVGLAVEPGVPPRIIFTAQPGGESSLSGGQKELLTLAYVLTLASHYEGPLILDDFAGRFDKLHAERAAALLKEIAKSRQIIIVTRHDSVVEESNRIFGLSMNKECCSKVSVLDV